MSVPRRPVGWSLISIGVLFAAVYLIAIADPVGTKAADDGDPFGAPPPASTSITGLLAGVAAVAVGTWLIRGKTTVRVD